MRRISRILVLLVVVALAGCQSCPQAGTYTGFKGKLGTETLKVNADGTLTHQYGPSIIKGIWVAISNEVIRATLDVIDVQGGSVKTKRQTRYYYLDPKKKEFKWDYRAKDCEEFPAGDVLKAAPEE